MMTDSQLDRSTDDSCESAVIDVEEFWERTDAEARVRRFRRWARFEACVFLLFSFSPFAIWVWDSFYGLVNRGFQASISEIWEALLFSAVLATFPIISAILVFSCRGKHQAVIPRSLIYGRYLSWTWLPVLIVMIIGVFDVSEIYFRYRPLSGYATEYWTIIQLLIHLLWNSCVLFTLRGTRSISLSGMPTLLLGNVILFAHGVAGWFLLALAGV